jgi:hypothetical protein
MPAVPATVAAVLVRLGVLAMLVRRQLTGRRTVVASVSAVAVVARGRHVLLLFARRVPQDYEYPRRTRTSPVLYPLRV